jgi:Ran GTPase-activating protein (RanGAP) involved in mRNA processing and transport
MPELLLPLMPQGLVALAPGIAASASLVQLNLEAKGLTAAGCATLGEALAANSRTATSADRTGYTGIAELLLGQNSLGGDGLSALLEGVGSSVGLRTLDLSSCSLEGEGAVQPLAAALQQGKLPSLGVLRLDGNTLSGTGIAALADTFGAAASLQQLHLQRCCLGPEAAAALAPALPSALQVLNLAGNTIGSRGALALAAAMTAGSVPQLHKLVLCDCGLGDDGIAAVAAALGATAAGSLALDLSGNTAGSAAMAALAAAPLTALCLHDCKLGGPGGGAVELTALLAQPASFAQLKELDLSGNGLEASQLLAVLEAAMADAGSLPCLRLLVIAANPGAAEAEVADAVERLQELRPDLDVVRRAADTGEGGLMG